MSGATADGQKRLPLLSVPGFVGRDAQLAALAGALAHRPALVLVDGEAGIGKSRLVQEFLASPAGRAHRALVAVCPPFRQPYTLGPLVDAVRQATDRVGGLGLSGLAGALRPLFPEWAGELPPAPEPLEDAGAVRHRSFRALAELLDRLAVTLLVVDDAHWADEATLEFLLFLHARPARTPPPSLLVTCRPEDVPADSVLHRLAARPAAGVTRLRLPLGSLEPEETARMVTLMLDGEPMSADFGEFLHGRTGGIPLVVEESVRLMYDRGDLVRRGGVWVRRRLHRIDVPPSVRDSVLERVGRLGDGARAVVRAAAVLGEPSPYATVAVVAGLAGDAGDDAAVDAAVGEAVASGLLRTDSDGRLSMRHALASQAVYEAVPAGQRRALHLRAGRALERLGPPVPARLSHHFQHAGDVDRWCRYAEQAAEAALATGHHAVAATLLCDLLTTADLPTPTVLRLARELPLVALVGRDRFERLAEVLRSVLRRATLTAREEGEARFFLGLVLGGMDRFEEGSAELERAIARLESEEPLLAAAAMTFLGWPRGPAPASVHLSWLRRAAAVDDRRFPPARRLALLGARVNALLTLGEEEGWAEASRSPELAGVQPDPSSAPHHCNLGECALLWGRYAEAARRLDLALHTATDHGYPRIHYGALTVQVYLRWCTGAWDGLLDRAEALAGDDDAQPMPKHGAVLTAGLLHAARGNGERAAGWLRQAADDASRQGRTYFVMHPVAALAMLALARGDVGEALRVSDEPVEIVAGKGVWVWATELAPARVAALVAAGRTDEAAELADAFARGLAGRDVPAPLAAVPLCRAVVAEARGEHARAAELFGRAAAAWQALPRPYDALLARERQAGCLLAAGAPSTALPILADVHSGLSTLGATGDAGRVAALLRAHRLPQARGRPSYGDDLSPRELDVVRLLAGGRTNQQIADALVLSRQTVASHVRSAMRKLRVPTRTAVVVRALELGLIDPPTVGDATMPGD